MRAPLPLALSAAAMAAAALTVSTGPAAMAGPARHHGPTGACYREAEITNYVMPNPRQVYVAMLGGRVVRIDLRHDCPSVGGGHTIGLKSRGASMVCNHFDDEVVVGGPGGPLYCPVAHVRELSRGIPVGQFVEHPKSLEHNGIHLNSFQIDPDAFTADGLAAIWTVRSLATTVTVRLRPDAKSSTRGEPSGNVSTTRVISWS